MEIEGLDCRQYGNCRSGRIAYVLYPMGILSSWAGRTAERYGIAISVITGMDWQNVFSPWPAPGVPKGTPDFKGDSRAFLGLLTESVVPRVEEDMGFGKSVERTLVGVSMSGLFALWQWAVCDVFSNIASLSGSFWYEGFVSWLEGCPFPHKEGRAYFLLGDSESKTRVKAFKTVESDTRLVVDYLSDKGVDVDFEMVPGNHYSSPITRLDKAFSALFGS